ITRVTAQDVAHGAKDGVGPRELRRFWKGPIVTAGGFDRDQAEAAIGEGWADAVAYGVPFLANPDLPRRLKERLPLNAPDEGTFYGGGEKGYTDYPAA
ncbi:MAG: alkene reductase, partial [Opitutia bacterium]